METNRFHLEQRVSLYHSLELMRLSKLMLDCNPSFPPAFWLLHLLSFSFGSFSVCSQCDSILCEARHHHHFSIIFLDPCIPQPSIVSNVGHLQITISRIVSQRMVDI